MNDDEKFNYEQIMSAQWSGVGAGSFNQVFVSKKAFTLKINEQSYHCRWVRKKPLEKNLQSECRRAVRVWNELYSDNPATQNPLNKYEWLAPYFGYHKANDSQAAEAVVKVYKKTGRIVVDACGADNVLVHHNEVKIIDIDVALNPHSPASKDFARREIQYNPVRCGYDDFWDGQVASMPKTVNVIKTLCYLEQQLGELGDIRVMLDLPMVELLHSYRIGHRVIDIETLIMLSKNSEDEKKLNNGYAQGRFFSSMSGDVSDNHGSDLSGPFKFK